MGALFSPKISQTAAAPTPATAIQSTTTDPVLELATDPSLDIKKKRLGKGALRVDSSGLVIPTNDTSGLQIPKL
jgi:hypothetical protein